MLVGKSNQGSVEFGALANPGGKARDDVLDSKAESSYEDAGQKLERISQEIVNLYLKIKRCSKDVNITESQYLAHVETTEDREERLLIAKMDPMIVLQYINVSIDVIINLKFEDIENKIAETAGKREVSDQKNGEYKDKNAAGHPQDGKAGRSGKKREGINSEGEYEHDGRQRDGEADNNTNEDLEISNQLEELVVEDTPQQIRDKVKKIAKPMEKQAIKKNTREATVILKKSKTQSMNGLGTRRGISESDQSMSKYSIKSIQPLDSARGPGAHDEQASSYDDNPSCPRIYEEIIQQLEADIRKHIRIEHQLKLHIESVEDRVEELERDLEKLEKK